MPHDWDWDWGGSWYIVHTASSDSYLSFRGLVVITDIMVSLKLELSRTVPPVWCNMGDIVSLEASSPIPKEGHRVKDG